MEDNANYCRSCRDIPGKKSFWTICNIKTLVALAIIIYLLVTG